MTDLGTAPNRLIAGLWSGSGRTLVIAGPPQSGKSELLQRIRHEVETRGGRLHTIRGQHRDRDLPYAAMETWDRPTLETLAEPTPPPEDSEAPSPAGMAFVPMDPDAAPTSRRRGSGARGRGGVPHLLPPTGRNPIHVDPEEFWQDRVRELREDPHAPVLLCVEEAVSIDAESREVLLYVSERARLRPVGLVILLDTSAPATAQWEERLLGHSDTDWVRLPPRLEPRELRLVQDAYELLPAACRRVLAMAALLGGPVSEVTLSRVTRLNFNQLAEALLPAVEAGLVKIDQGRFEFVRAGFGTMVPEQLSPAERGEFHREVAEALAALNPEPSLERRLELARHYFEWYKGPNALRYLLETAELTDRLHAYDTTLDALAKALECVPSLPAADRLEASCEIRFLQVRALAFAGQLPEAEQAFREGYVEALSTDRPPERLEEWTEGLIPVLTTIGPRPSFVTLLVETAERAHAREAVGVEIILQAMIARFDLDRGRLGKAREEARRAARLASGAAPGVPQAMALEAVGLTRLDGTAEEQGLAEKFLTTAKKMLASARRYPLEQEAESALLAVQEARAPAEREAARRARERALTHVERARNLPVELDHRLELAAMLLDETADARAAALLRRAHEIVDLLHLVPPSPFLLRLWLLEGRFEARAGSAEAARSRLEAVADQPAGSTPARVRAEARLRLALLEASLGRDESARPHVAALAHPELREALRPEWKEWLAPLESRLAPETDQPASTANAPGSSA